MLNIFRELMHEMIQTTVLDLHETDLLKGIENTVAELLTTEYSQRRDKLPFGVPHSS